MGLPVVFLVGLLSALTVPARTLITAILICCVIAMLLGYGYRYRKGRKIEITIRNGWIIFLLPVVIVTLSAAGLFAPATNKLLEVVSGVLVVFLFAIVFGYRYRRGRKFGISICHLETLPAFIGGTLKAEIEIQFPKVKTGLPELPDGPVEAELVNVRVGPRIEIVNWMAKTTIPDHAVTRPGDGTLRIQVAIEIPNEAIERIGQGASDSRWSLRLRAPFAAVDYASQFGVPVVLPVSGGRDSAKTMVASS